MVEAVIHAVKGAEIRREAWPNQVSKIYFDTCRGQLRWVQPNLIDFVVLESDIDGAVSKFDMGMHDWVATYT